MSKGHKLNNGLTAKEERFAQLLAQGYSQSDALREVWPAVTERSQEGEHVAASEKANRPKVRLRVQELMDRAGEAAVVNIQSMSRQFDSDREFARECKQAGAAVTASTQKAKLHGLLQDRSSSPAATLEALAALIETLDGRGERAKVIDGVCEDGD